MSETHYARTAGGVHIAHQVDGAGPRDLIEIYNGTNFSFDAAGEQPRWQAYVDRLASFTRLIRFDPRGIGLSDPLDPNDPPTVEQLAGDALAVLDAVGSRQAAVLAVGTGGPAAMYLASAHPDRVTALLLVNTCARYARDVDYPAGVPSEVLASFLTSVSQPDGGTDDIPMMLPSLAGDANFRTWWRRTGYRGASPATASTFNATALTDDVRSVIGCIQAPTLVLHAGGNQLMRPAHGRYLAEHIAGAKYIELATDDHVPWGSDADYAGEYEEFLTGARATPVAERQLATVLFTDIVGSTVLASALGDRAWRERLDQYDALTGRLIDRFGGRVVKSTGDGTLATFGGPARAIACASAIRDAVRQVGLEIRAGIHTGEIEVRGADIAGIAVHLSQRVSALAGTGEVFVSRTVVDLVAGSGIEFDDQGEHELKGVPDRWRVFQVRD